MRAAGIDERFISGKATPEEKFRAWAGTVPQLLRNPLYDWNRLELWTFFGIADPLTPETATRIWDESNRQLRQNPLTPSHIFSKCRVASLGTTDDPADSLQWHERCREQSNLPRVAPTFRPDRALAIDQPADFVEWLSRLGTETNRNIESLDELLAALEQRHQAFDALGCRSSDHGLPRLFAADPDLSSAARIFRKVFVMQTPDSSPNSTPVAAGPSNCTSDRSGTTLPGFLRPLAAMPALIRLAIGHKSSVCIVTLTSSISTSACLTISSTF
jgi:glucuronate isomerase